MNQSRIDRIMVELSAVGLSQMLISDLFSIKYLTGDAVHPNERFYALLLREGQRPLLVLNKLFCSPSVAPENVIPYDDTEHGPLKLLPYLDSAKPLGIDKNLPAGFLIELMEAGAASAYVNSSPCVDRVRQRKDAEEIEKMIRVSQMNDAAITLLKKEVREGVTERELADKLARIYKDLGAEGLSFSSIISFGAHAADPHHSPDDTPLRAGDCVLFDIGCVKDGYCSDMTRTYYFKSVTAKEREVYETVKRANLTAEAAMKPGVRFCDLDAAARKVISDAGYGPYFTHRLGHGIGQEDHEWGDVGAANQAMIAPGMIFSCEPGIYLPGETGVRIEDLCLVTEDGVKILNSVSKELEVLE